MRKGHILKKLPRIISIKAYLIALGKSLFTSTSFVEGVFSSLKCRRNQIGVLGVAEHKFLRL